MSEIVFKKKTTKAKIRKRTTSLDTEDEPSSLGTSANESSNTDQTQDEQEQDTSSILGDFKLLRKLRTKSRGVDASDLEKGDAETRRRRKLEKEKEKEEDDDPWKMKTGGLVDLDEVKEKEGTSFMASFTGRNQTLDVNKHLETYIETELKKKRGVTVEEQISPEEDKSKSLEDELYKLPDHLKVCQIVILLENS
ncbi:hypothetical protein BKA69DRAFT_381738 [Paraphysoderma sedebokerense]|nr:hypothetical protein BKA69DRAFT_381738 [Paraphysoderma sedebokerense]